MRNAADLHQHIYIPFHTAETSPSKFGLTAEVTGWCSENLSSHLSAPTWFSSWDNVSGTQCVPCPALLKGGRGWQSKLPFHPLSLLKHISNVSQRLFVGCYRQRKRRHFCHVGCDNLWAECWHGGVLSHPQCMSACMPASTPAWVKNLQDTFRLAPTPV